MVDVVGPFAFFSSLNSPPVNGRHGGSVCSFSPLNSLPVNSSYDNIIFLLQGWVINNKKWKQLLTDRKWMVCVCVCDGILMCTVQSPQKPWSSVVPSPASSLSSPSSSLCFTSDVDGGKCSMPLVVCEAKVWRTVVELPHTVVIVVTFNRMVPSSDRQEQLNQKVFLVTMVR